MHPLTEKRSHGAAGALAGALALAGEPGPAVVYYWNPLRPSDRRVFRATLGQTINELRPQHPRVMCVLNGEPILAADWDYVPQAHEHVAFHCLPRGGGGGGSNVLTVVLALVVIVVGAFTYNPYLIAAGVGMLAVGLLPTPNFTPIAAPTAQQEVSPTYSLQLQGNTARLGQAIPVPYGYHWMIPDFGSQPYSEFDSEGEQYYHALFCLGMAPAMTLVNTFIDDTPLAHFNDVETQLIGPAYGSTTLTLINPCVVNAPEVAQQDLLFGAIVGPFSASGPGFQCTKIGIDILCPKGLYYANDDGTLASKTVSWQVEARALTDAGGIAGVWFLLGTEELTLAQSKAVRRTYTYTVPAGRYQVRMQRTTERDDNTRAGHDIQWLGMRAYLTATVPLDTNANYLAVKMRASSQLSGLSQRRFACIVQRLLPTWSPLGGWTAPVATNSIAWALADVLRNSVYGGDLADSRIDLQTLYELDQVWDARGDEFNGIFDKRNTIWSTLATIARAGRARPIMRGGVFTFVRDCQQTLPVALFNMRNIQRGSFSLDYTMWTENSADGVELEYYSAETWSSAFVRMPMPGEVDEPVVPARMSIVGITSENQAQREAAYYVAESAYRRTMVSFTTEMEGFLPGFGDLIAVAHDVAGWGNSGEVLAWNGITATGSEDIDWSVGNNYAVITDAAGDVYGPYLVTQGTDARDIRFLESVPSGVMYVGHERDRTRYAVGPANAYAKLCKVVSITPQEGDLVQIRAVVEDDRVHTADAPYAGSGGGGGGGAYRTAHYAPDGLSDYNAASDAQRARYGYFTDSDRTVGTSNDAGYVYDS